VEIDPPSTEPAVVSRLELDQLERGRRHDLLLHLADDGLGFPLHVPIIVARGRTSGPVFGLLAGLHGNELNGIWVIHELMASLDPEKVRGTVVAAVVANAPGIIRRQRTFSDGQDLNRVFPGRAEGNPSQVWAYRLRTRIVRKFDYLLDLHTAGRGRLNCVYVRVDLDDRKSRTLARVLRPQLVVHKPPGDRSLRGWASSHGIPAVTLEIGDPQRRQEDLTSMTVRGARRALRWAKMLPGRVSVPRKHDVECRRSRWIYTTAGGLLDVFPEVGSRVAEGQLLGWVHDVFGRLVEEYVAPADGWVVGKTADPVAQTGARVVHLGFER
jgi:uncharacterized protein